MRYTFTAKVWVYPGQGGWQFVTIPADISDSIAKFAAEQRAAFGSIGVMAEIGTTQWKTSLFPDKRTKSFLLPLKAKIRRQEKISDGDSIEFSLTIEP